MDPHDTSPRDREPSQPSMAADENTPDDLRGNHCNNHDNARHITHTSATPAKDSRPAPPKRKSSEAMPRENGNSNNGSAEGKKKRRKVNHACVYCRRSHMTCDLQRPCARCIKRDIGHLCHDEPREPPKRSKSDVGVAEIAPAPGDGLNGDNHKPDMPAPNGGGGGVQYALSNHSGDIPIGPVNANGAPPQLIQPQPMSPSSLHRPANSGSSNASNFLQSFDWNNSGVHNQFQDMHHLHPNYMFNTSEVTNEYNLLNDFLSTSLLDDGGLYNSEDAQTLFNDPLMATSSMNALAGSNHHSAGQHHPTLPPPGQALIAQEISRPSSTFPVDSRARDKFYMTAADPAGMESAENRLHKLLKAKYEAGMLKPFNYVKGYARLNQYMSKHLSRESQLRILKQLDRFRPKFREAMQSLTDMQLVLVEMWFERSLMEYDRVFASMAIPACCWRRTGEIFRGNTEMAELIHVSGDKLRDGRLAIHEIIAQESLVSYWEKFGAIAFDQSQKAILTSCSLKRPVKKPSSPAAGGSSEGLGQGPMETIRCCFSFTIKRDSHNIPSVIVGNFLPVQPHQPPGGSS